MLSTPTECFAGSGGRRAAPPRIVQRDRCSLFTPDGRPNSGRSSATLLLAQCWFDAKSRRPFRERARWLHKHAWFAIGLNVWARRRCVAHR
jgi:hypothetical protein